MTESEKPASCPFCGAGEDLHDPFAIDIGEEGQPAFRVNCAECLVYGPELATEAEAIRAWNKRAAAPVPAAGLAACPFCGFDVQVRVRHDPDTGSADRIVECTSCGTWGGIGEDSMADVRTAWNRRRGV